MKIFKFFWLSSLGLIFTFNINPVRANICQQFLKSTALVDTNSEIELFLPWDQLIPGQTHYGKYIVDQIYGKKNLKITETETSVILNKKIPIIEVITPEKSYYLMIDNHHTLASFVKENQKDKSLLVAVDVVKTVSVTQFDYTAMQSFAKQGLVWSPDPINSKWELNSNWPKTVLQLKDMPVRSMVQLLFLELDLSGKSFSPFIQFYLAELLLKVGFEFNEKSFKTTKKLNKAKESLLKFALDNPIILETLKNNIVPNDAKKALEKLTVFESSNKKH